MTTNPLSGRVALVTGAASGIGAATARRLAADGARVALVARRTDRLRALADDIGDRALALPADLTQLDTIDPLIDETTDRLGTIDLLVNNAAIMLPNPVTDQRGKEWQRMIDLNLAALLHITRATLPGLLSAAVDGRAADVVNISSTGADAPVSAFAVYGATKAAVSYFSRALRTELAATGVRVTDIKPGGVATELFDHATHPQLRERMVAASNSGKLLYANDIADTISYVVTRPEHICLSQITVVPRTQPA
ncbi:SDR family oxidoreductase [Nocardia niigatensis]|uniref:SDR family oxidoreductase n=1 Tax=Nocardia niigatensis TaxID=209249 RepID=UPI000593921F|nr:SDR family oxidoreductase [Nocardia niigatensis]